MIIFKVAVTAVMLSGLLVVAFIVADVLTNLRYKWLDNLTESIISAFLKTLVTAFAAGFIYVCGLLVYEIWTQL